MDAAKAVLRGLKSRKEKTGKTGIYIHTVSCSFFKEQKWDKLMRHSVDVFSLEPV